MSDRIAIGQKTRYEVFKRDHFRCTRCAAQPAENNEISLELDHIHPLALGGTNDLDNLQTLCKDCNRGKRDTPDTSVPESLEAKAQRIAENVERQAQIEGAAEAIREEKTRVERQAVEHLWAIVDILHGNQAVNEIPARDESTIRTFIKQLGFRKCRDAALLAVERGYTEDNGVFRYFCGTCHRINAENKQTVKRPTGN